jgi:hypothetical protein
VHGTRLGAAVYLPAPLCLTASQAAAERAGLTPRSRAIAANAGPVGRGDDSRNAKTKIPSQYGRSSPQLRCLKSTDGAQDQASNDLKKT